MWFSFAPKIPHFSVAAPRLLATACISLAVAFPLGCGTTKLQEATEQLVLSQAVDNSIAAIDFRPLSGYNVYFDDTYIKTVKTTNIVNAEYVISSLRQQIIAAGCKLQEKIDTADVIVEGRIGTLGADDHRVTYGIPENNVLGVASQFSGSPFPMPGTAIPELAIARRDAREGAAKVAAFAYDRVTREPIWQSGISKSIATSRNTWVMGVGPFQGGTIRDLSATARKDAQDGAGYVRNMQDVNSRPPVNYSAEVRYDKGWPMTGRPRPPAESEIDGFTPAATVAGLPPGSQPTAAPPNGGLPGGMTSGLIEDSNAPMRATNPQPSTLQR